MSGSTIGGVIGGVIGVWTGIGWQAGWVIGSTIGGYVDPTQIEGPRLSDGRNQTSRDGVAIPFGWGVFPIAGNVIWQQPDVSEHEHTEDGKGSGTEQVTYTYTRSHAIGICEGPITALLQIYRNKKLVYDARDTATIEEELREGGLTAVEAVKLQVARRAEQAKFKYKCAIYLGDETQNPDPTIESYKGVGNVSSYRGMAYIVVTDDETIGGEIAQYDFVVAACGTSEIIEGPTAGDWLIAFTPEDGLSVEIGLTAEDWSASGFMPSPSAWAADSYTYAATNENSVLLVTISSAIGGYGIFSSDRGLTWSEITGVSPSAGRGQCVHIGGFWNVCGPGDVLRSSDGISYSSVATAPDADTICKSGSDLFAATASRNIYRSTDSGGVWSLEATIPFPGYAWTQFTMDGSGSALGMVILATGSFGGTGAVDARAHILSCDDDGVTWTEETNPFPDAIDPSTLDRPRIHYSEGQALWFVSFQDRIAYGASLDSLSLSAHIFPTNILCIESDDTNVTVSGRSGVLETSTDGGVTWDALSPGMSSDIWVIAHMGEAGGGLPMPDAPGWEIDQEGNLTGGSYEVVTPCTPTRGEVVASLCELSGLTPDDYDVSELTDIITGFVVARETDAASAINSIMPVNTPADPGEWDGKLRFTLRGGTSVFAINSDDLVERDGDPFERERVQEAELLFKSTVGYIDPAASYGPITQSYSRRSGTVQARGESLVEIPVTMSGDQAATLAKRRVFTAWGEPEKQKLTLPYRLSAITATDVGTYTDDDAEVHPLRVVQTEDDEGPRFLETVTNCAEVYGATASGVRPKPPTVTGSGLIGPTQTVVMDLPLWRTGDPDDIGLYGAFSGYPGMDGWSGAQADISVDAGTTYGLSVQANTPPAAIGYTVTALDAWDSSENPEDQSVTVWLPVAPSSVTYEVLLTYANRAAVQLDSGSWEIMQYQTVAPLGDDLYTLSGLVRGRFNTTPGDVSIDATFVLLNESVLFVPTPRDAMGETLTIRVTSYGTSNDAATPFDYAFTEGNSQTEWPVHNVEAERDSSGDVSVSCIIRDRLGSEVTRYPSVHFIGLRFNYTDGVDTFSYDVSNTAIGTSSFGTHTYTSAMQTADFGGVPGSLTVTIQPLNDITGAGPLSAGVAV